MNVTFANQVQICDELDRDAVNGQFALVHHCLQHLWMKVMVSNVLSGMKWLGFLRNLLYNI